LSASYTIDTNIIVTLNRDQPRDIYASMWDALEALIADGRCVMNREAYEELVHVDDECAPWAKVQDGFVQDTTNAELAVVDSITTDHPGWVQETKNAADPFVIAQAVERELVVVTFERRKGLGTEDHNLKIPNVADEWQVECIDFKELARREGWVF
jgi:hypothetical protein